MVGSMAPDFPYIVGTTEYRDLGHHFPGLIWFTIPASFAALWLFHMVIKQPVIGLMPLGMQARLCRHASNFRFSGKGRFLAILGSLIFGIATHILWDSFTHRTGWAYREFRFLHGPVCFPFVGPVAGYAILQYASTIAGIFALAIWVLLWYRRTSPSAIGQPPQPARSRFGLAVAMFVVAGSIGFARATWIVGNPAGRSGATDKFFVIFAVTALALAFWELLLYCVLMSTHQTRTIT